MPTTDELRAAWEATRDALDPADRPHARPIAAWDLHAAPPTPTSSHMGGAPGLVPGEPWPESQGKPMRFWAQLNLADLAPYAEAFGIAMPVASGLVQLFAAEEGGELARHIAADRLDTLELREDIPGTDYTFGPVLQHSLAITLRPGAQLPGRGECLAGYSFGWWPLSRQGLTWAARRSGVAEEDWTFLAVAASNAALQLSFSDEGFLWATLPRTALAGGRLEELHAAGESS
jgi:hypothetical protein